MSYFPPTHDVERHVAEHGQIVWPVVHAVSSGVFVHGHVEAPVQTILDTPMTAHDFAAAFGRDRRAE